jgi:hypothetical protein
VLEQVDEMQLLLNIFNHPDADNHHNHEGASLSKNQVIEGNKGRENDPFQRAEATLWLNSKQ